VDEFQVLREVLPLEARMVPPPVVRREVLEPTAEPEEMAA